MCDKIVKLQSSEGDSITCRVASTFWTRFRGLMVSPPPPPGEGLLITNCNSIHMFFMRFAIDAIFLDDEFRIVKLVKDLAPGKLVGAVKGAKQVIELVSGSTPESFEPGGTLDISPV
jgi:hypothetical protein